METRSREQGTGSKGVTWCQPESEIMTDGARGGGLPAAAHRVALVRALRCTPCVPPLTCAECSPLHTYPRPSCCPLHTVSASCMAASAFRCTPCPPPVRSALQTAVLPVRARPKLHCSPLPLPCFALHPSRPLSTLTPDFVDMKGRQAKLLDACSAAPRRRIRDETSSTKPRVKGPTATVASQWFFQGVSCFRLRKALAVSVRGDKGTRMPLRKDEETRVTLRWDEETRVTLRPLGETP